MHGKPITSNASTILSGSVWPVWYARPWRFPKSWHIASARSSISSAITTSREPPYQHYLCSTTEMILHAALDPAVASRARRGEFVTCLDHFDLLQSPIN